MPSWSLVNGKHRNMFGNTFWGGIIHTIKRKDETPKIGYMCVPRGFGHCLQDLWYKIMVHWRFIDYTILERDMEYMRTHQGWLVEMVQFQCHVRPIGKFYVATRNITKLLQHKYFSAVCPNVGVILRGNKCNFAITAANT